MPPTSNPWLYLIGLVFTFLSGIGLKDIIVGLLGRKPKKAVEVTNQIDLAKQASEYAEKLEADADASRASAMKAWAAVDEAQQKLVRANRRLDDSVWKLELAGRYMDGLFAKIWEQGATIEGVRHYISSQPPIPFKRNGQNSNEL